VWPLPHPNCRRDLTATNAISKRSDELH
jgi:hypothetical protein